MCFKNERCAFQTCQTSKIIVCLISQDTCLNEAPLYLAQVREWCYSCYRPSTRPPPIGMCTSCLWSQCGDTPYHAEEQVVVLLGEHLNFSFPLIPGKANSMLGRLTSVYICTKLSWTERTGNNPPQLNWTSFYRNCFKLSFQKLQLSSSSLWSRTAGTVWEHFWASTNCQQLLSSFSLWEMWPAVPGQWICTSLPRRRHGVPTI